MSNSVLILSALAVVLAVFSGCGSEPSAPAPVDMKVELMRAWREIPNSASEDLDVGSASVIAQRLAQMGMEGLNPLLDVIGGKDEDPMAKVLAVISLTPLMRPEMAPRLIEFTAEGNETTTRACAANLLALLDTPEAAARIQVLCGDSEQRVRVAAQLAMIARRDPGQIARIFDLWKDPAMDSRQRTQLVLVLPDTNEQEYLPIFAEALANQQLDPAARQRAASALGRLGDASSLPVLEQCVKSDPDERVTSLAQAAIEAIQARASAPSVAPSVAPVPESAPAPGAAGGDKV